MNSHNENDEPTLYTAIINKQWKMAQLLIEHKAQFTNSNWSDECNEEIPNILHYAIQDENVDESFIDFLLSQTSTKAIHIEQKVQYGYTPILTAARYGNLRILKHLISNFNPNVHVQTNNGYNLFHCAILSESKCTIELLDTIKLFGININLIAEVLVDFDRKATPLTLAIYNGLSFDIIKHLVELGADIITTNDRKYNPNGDNSTDSNVQSHLFKAIKFNDDYKIFNYLVQSCPGSYNIPFKSILKQEFDDINFESIKFIIENYHSEFNNDQHQIDLFQSIFLNAATTRHLFHSPKFPLQLQMIEYLLGQNVQNCFKFSRDEYCFQYHTTPLLIFARYPQSSLRLLQLMVQNGANVHDYNDFGMGVLETLCQLEAGIVEDIITKIDYFISIGMNINCSLHPVTGDVINTPFHYAISNETFATTLVQHLIQHHNATIAPTEANGSAPLHYVVHPELVPLLSSPLTINHRDENGSTPLLVTLQAVSDFMDNLDDYYQIIFNLIHCGADVNIPNYNGKYPIHVIFRKCWYQPINVIQLLIEQQHIDLNVIFPGTKSTPLLLVIQRFIQPSYSWTHVDGITFDDMRLKAIQSMKLLLQYNANITPPISGGRTVLHYVIMDADVKDDPFICINDDLMEDVMVSMIDAFIDQTILNQLNIPNSNQD